MFKKIVLLFLTYFIISTSLQSETIFKEIGNITFPGQHSAHLYVAGDYAYCPLWEDG